MYYKISGRKSSVSCINTGLVLVVFTFFCALSTSFITAQALDDESRFLHHLEVGEYGVAEAILGAQDDLQVQDRWRAVLAESQITAGAYSQAVQNASQIEDDVARAQSLRSLRSSVFDSGAPGRAGGGSIADFDSLIELVQTTVAPDSWDAVGGPGSIAPFASGVFVDAEGTLKLVERRVAGTGLSDLRRAAEHALSDRNPRRKSRLRKVSLNRLEKVLQVRAAVGQEATETMQHLAGLRRIEYLFVYPDTGDIVIAGPANDWNEGIEGRIVDVESGAPVLQLDDLVVCLRNSFERRGRFGCSIDPRRENLAATKAFLETSSLAGDRRRKKLQETLGLQDITVHGVDPESRVARILVEADYRMKLVGMGLEKGTLGVPSYLDSISLGEAEAISPMDVVRWWFTLNYEAISMTKERNAYELIGPGVRVLSENELLTETGRRMGTGRANLPAQEFAHGFTENVEAMGRKYPVYAELRNVFDLAMIASLIKNEGIADRIDWNLTYFGDGDRMSATHEIARHDVAKQVDSVLNHRIAETSKDGRRFRHTLIGISGGVVVDAGRLSSQLLIEDQYGLMDAEREQSKPARDMTSWWWD